MNLNELTLYCKKNVPYYKALSSDLKCFEDFPFVSQLEVRKNFEDFVVPNIKYKVDRTSGSSGVATRVAYTDEDRVKAKFEMYCLRYRLHGIAPEDKFASFMNNSATEKIQMIKNHMSLSCVNVSEENISEYYQLIYDFDPVWLFIRPSIGILLTNYINENNKPLFPSLKYIEMSGEYLSNATRTYIHDTFKVQVSNMYGCTEGNGIAYECSCGKLHVFSNDVYVEVVKDGKTVIGEQGYIAITTLNNKTMPFVRYMNGDIGTLIESHCPCGDKNNILELNVVRGKDNIILPDNTKKDFCALKYLLNGINEDTNEMIMQVQFQQTTVYDFTARLVLNKNYSNTNDVSLLEELFKKHAEKAGLAHVKWHLEILDKLIPDASTGKVSAFISMYTNTGADF